jgi:murein tripeptide amidase MpaA
VHISSAFDSGNMDVLDASDPGSVRLAIRPDVGGEHYQWFHFRVSGVRGVACRFRITNAKGASYPDGWPGYRAFATEDGAQWFRIATEWDGGELCLSVTPASDVITIAYFVPYSYERHLGLIARAAAVPSCRHSVLGATVDGRPLDLLTIGAAAYDRLPIWVIARQHPGESMAEWWMEGFVSRLLDPNDGLAVKLLEQVTFYVVPNMNPDGSVRGHLRTNARGVNLNRVWDDPSPETSPEVYDVRRAMDESGVALCLDVHGDESIPYAFIAGAEGVPDVSPALVSATGTFCIEYEKANPRFQRVFGYEVDAPGAANLSMCTNQVAARYGAVGMTLEMPFKEGPQVVGAKSGWGPSWCARLGASSLDAFWRSLEQVAALRR